MKFLRPALIVFFVLLIDQSFKFWIKLTFTYNESRKIFDWCYLYFIENEGAAFGMSLGGESGKLILSLFRIIAVIGISYYLVKVINEKAHLGFIAALSLILAGALGNILDSVYYGVIFSESTQSTVATLFPPGGGYEKWLHGRVVDMLYFPLYEGFLPHWVPIWGGDYFIFFRPIFNIADASITTGVLMIVLFQKVFFKEEKTLEAVNKTETEEGNTPPEIENQ